MEVHNNIDVCRFDRGGCILSGAPRNVSRFRGRHQTAEDSTEFTGQELLHC